MSKRIILRAGYRALMVAPLLRAGKGILKVAHEVGVDHGTVERIAREMPRPFAAA